MGCGAARRYDVVVGSREEKRNFSVPEWRTVQMADPPCISIVEGDGTDRVDRLKQPSPRQDRESWRTPSAGSPKRKAEGCLPLQVPSSPSNPKVVGNASSLQPPVGASQRPASLGPGRALLTSPRPALGPGPGPALAQKSHAASPCIDSDSHVLGSSSVPSNKPKAPTLPQFSADDQKATRPAVSKVQIADLLGSGSAGRVFLGRAEDTGEMVAVKEFDVGGASELAKLMKQEVALLQGLQHNNIVECLGHAILDSGKRLHVFMEYMPGGSLSSVLAQFGAFDEPTIRRYCRQLLSGLVYLHSLKIIHRDLKAANVLLGVDGVVKLSDFGSCKELIARRSTGFESAPSAGPGGSNLTGIGEQSMTQHVLATTMVGSVLWMAPEVVQCDGYGAGADIWSLGCVVLEMKTGKQPWGGCFDNPMAALFAISKAEKGPPIPEDLSPEAQDFVRRCFCRKPSERPAASELEEHLWLEEESGNTMTHLKQRTQEL